MIISRAPVRFSLGGGGSDLPAYASQHGGFVVTAAVDKYVYICANRRFHDSIRLSYSSTEIVEHAPLVKHNIFREALMMLEIDHGIELTSMSDVPANSGLGSSGAFTVSLLNALHAYRREYVSTKTLADEACHIELDRLGAPIGKQDQYASAFGRICCLEIGKDLSVEVTPLRISDDTLAELESNLHVFYTGVDREASPILADQQKQMKSSDRSVEAMHRIKQLGYETRRLLTQDKLDQYGELMNEHWTEKRRLSAQVSSGTIDEHYAAARRAGALGGKIMGAGGGGFFLFYARENKGTLIRTMVSRGLRYIRFRFDMDGAKIVANLTRS
jgi:D-glycero-alpha-D-manno-heptose-7-phosphate kinase